jgi:hypothetical protein
MSLRQPKNIDSMAGRIFHFMRLELAVRNLCSLERITALEPISPLALPYTMRSFSDLILQAETACLELWAAMRSYGGARPTEAHLELVELKVDQALQLEKRLQDFETTVDSAWTYTTVLHPAPEHSAPFPMSNAAYVFSGIQLGAQWMALWCANVRLKDTLAASISASRNPSTRSTVINCLSKVNSGVGKICASVPFMLGEIDGSGHPRAFGDIAVGPAPMLLAPVLFIAGTSYPVQEKQKAWICDRLAQIGHQRGIGQARVFESHLRKTMRAC